MLASTDQPGAVIRIGFADYVSELLGQSHGLFHEQERIILICHEPIMLGDRAPCK